jgi:hypothetical protein
MPRIRLLPVVLVGGLCALVVGSTALAGGAPITHRSPAPVSQTNGRESEGLRVQKQETGEGAEDGQGSDKVAQAIADEFGVSKDEVLARHQQGIGFGALFKLYKLARAKGISIDDLLATIPTGANGEREFGFGQLRKSLTPEQRAAFTSGPKNLGQLVSGKNKHKAPMAEGAGDGSESAQPNASGKIPPGQAKKAARSQQASQ